MMNGIINRFGYSNKHVSAVFIYAINTANVIYQPLNQTEVLGS